jgi:hypothetical protein
LALATGKWSHWPENLLKGNKTNDIILGVSEYLPQFTEFGKMFLVTAHDRTAITVIGIINKLFLSSITSDCQAEGNILA